MTRDLVKCGGDVPMSGKHELVSRKLLVLGILKACERPQSLLRSTTDRRFKRHRYVCFRMRKLWE